MSKEIEIIGVQERRELAILTRAKYQDLISELKQNAQQENTMIVEKAAKKLGIDILKKEIKTLEEKILFCKTKIANLGFQESYGTLSFTTKYIEQDNVVDPNSPAGKIYYNVVGARPDVKVLEQERDKALSDIWLHPERKKIEEIVNRKVNIKMLSFSKE